MQPGGRAGRDRRHRAVQPLHAADPLPDGRLRHPLGAALPMRRAWDRFTEVEGRWKQDMVFGRKGREFRSPP